ncbi:pyridoxal-phosphate dependent enzyme [Terrilactibacillus sp. BCM23-1]|uniref:Pyridoxal-phosphate dependent enzyme n=1 Tax=Terrilactibacillus tamarindi TaxID=2599694 RepID=A0A6N8CQI1_9BACI|nr:cysteine synthase family protein [Terrilactibacillus tamarindi]MTT32469.1 pyridoxal-phosphate dependent enzyme [Terrilactibacillus tamarindi]
MTVYHRVHELIGHTPLLEITAFPLPKDVHIYAKLEMFNPGGSIKDRLGLAFIKDAIKNGKVKPGGTIIEPTAGNTGIGIALAAIGQGLNVIFCVPEKFSVEKQELMRALGAKIVHTPTSEGMQGAINKVNELLKEIPNSYSPQQFSNPANPKAYYNTLGPELWNDLNGKINIFIAGGGTGGTFMGTAEYLKERNPSIKTMIVEPEGSILNGGPKGSHRTEGIGMEFIPSYLKTNYFDKIYTIKDDDAFKRVHELAKKEGLLVGSSSGAAFHAAWKEAQVSPKGTNIVTVFPDSSERYLSQNIYRGD